MDFNTLLSIPEHTIPLVISVDYELFFSSNTGTVDQCLIHPVKELLKIVDKYIFFSPQFIRQKKYSE